jgi:uncharacterized protein (TIGR04255 family)
VNIYPVYPHAPIIEALLDIRAQLPNEVELTQLENYHNQIKDRFPEKKQRVSIEVKAGVQIASITETSLSTSGGPDGFFFRSPNERKIVQARLDGFTFNKLKPYENWELFSSEAKNLWNIFCQVANPIKITRVALRYINKIFFPLPMKDFKEYILTIPEVAPNLPQGLTQLFARLWIPKPEIEALAIITETMEEPNQDQKLPFIFDIDVFKGIDYSEPDRIWKDFEELRQFKNEVFFNSLTEKAKEMFK